MHLITKNKLLLPKFADKSILSMLTFIFFVFQQKFFETLITDVI